MKNLIIIFLILPISVFSQDIFSYENSIKYAKYLSDSSFYQKADKEYVRLMGIYQDSIKVKKLYFQNAYLNKDYSAIGEGFTNDYDYLIYERGFDVIYAKSLIFSNKKLELDNYLLKSGFSDNDLSFYLLNYQLIYESIDSLQVINWENYTLNNNYIALRDEITSFNKKSMFLSISLSAIIPGLGKAYNNKPLEGFQAFSVIVVSSFVAYRGFSEKGLQSGLGWVYGISTLGLYGGNIYGAWRSCNEYNTNFENYIHEKASDYLYNY